MQARLPIQFYFVVGGTLALLFTMALQYPLVTTFPIGGDATRYILKLLEVPAAAQEDRIIEAGTKLFTNTSYPGAQIILATSALLPVPWPERFTWWMSLGHIATGLMIGYLAWRVSDWRAAVASIAIWSLTFVSVLPDIEDGTLAQLWSFPFVIWFLERCMQRSWMWAAIAAVLSMATHPISGAIILLVGAISLPIIFRPSLPHKGRLKLQYLAFTIFITLAFASTSRFIFQSVRSVLTAQLPFESSEPFTNILYSPFGPFLIMAPIGVFLLMRQKPVYQLIPLLTFTVLGLLLAFNDRIGAGFYPSRFLSYPIISATVFAAIALPTLLKSAVPYKALRWSFAVLLIMSSALYTWNDNSRIFAFYESPSKYARLHPHEHEAIEWLKENTPADVFVVSSNANRHSEWIPILSTRQWRPLVAEDTLWNLKGDALHVYLKDTPYTHLALFKHREKPSDLFPLDDSAYPIVFENKGAMIIQLK